LLKNQALELKDTSAWHKTADNTVLYQRISSVADTADT